MTISELIRDLKHIEANHGDMEVEANNTAGDLNPVEKVVIEPIRQNAFGKIKHVVVIES